VETACEQVDTGALTFNACGLEQNEITVLLVAFGTLATSGSAGGRGSRD
jgi:hypothetical protein